LEHKYVLVYHTTSYMEIRIQLVEQVVSPAQKMPSDLFSDAMAQHSRHEWQRLKVPDHCQV